MNEELWGKSWKVTTEFNTREINSNKSQLTSVEGATRSSWGSDLYSSLAVPDP